jgi:hypothetical protein
MTPILDRPDERATVKYLQEENALLKDACIQARTRLRTIAGLIDYLIHQSQCDGPMASALTDLKKTIDL